MNKRVLHIAIAIHAAILAPHYLGYPYLGSIKGAIWVSMIFMLLANFLFLVWEFKKKEKEMKSK
ncbi:hypothetical protein P872_03865 [Rhodonellum psychrophilum GCM71 = DSM 17998]|uniref:Uncharacterized protein n=2 Tax=Rhodonellum TaxID=336827 RepID=U5BQF4_9BACT|nr:hypothetical protein P872_03865 [Rhodonellum psychrophilum GCM71 = DSM 17998]SDY96330.1 hypothetical protein SAMN05444412_10472 [Rhodonellum ikkaensis]